VQRLLWKSDPKYPALPVLTLRGMGAAARLLVIPARVGQEAWVSI
jgi:hypothetical protein